MDYPNELNSAAAEFSFFSFAVNHCRSITYIHDTYIDLQLTSAQQASHFAM